MALLRKCRTCPNRWGCNMGLPVTKLETACILWNRPLRPDGRGEIRVNNKLWLAHRWVYHTEVGPLTDGMVVMHRCDNPACVNPLHLVLGTHADNVADKVRKGRQPAAGDAGMAKLTTREMVEVRDLANCGLFTLQKIGDVYGVNRSCICRIRNGTRGASAKL